MNLVLHIDHLVVSIVIPSMNLGPCRLFDAEVRPALKYRPELVVDATGAVLAVSAHVLLLDFKRRDLRAEEAKQVLNMSDDGTTLYDHLASVSKGPRGKENAGTNYENR